MMMEHLLTWMIFAPLAGAVALLFVPSREKAVIKTLAAVTALVPIVLSVPLFLRFDRAEAGMQFVEHTTWIPDYHIEYFLGVDGLSITMVLLTAALGLICIIASWGIDKGVKGYFPLFLLLESGMMGVFCALDFILFYVFWELMLLPMYFLIGIWGGPRREYAAIKFFLYTLAGSVLMLLVILAFYWNSSVALDDATRADLARVGYTEGHFAAARAEGGWRSFDLTRLSEMSLLRHRMRQSKGEIPLDAAGPVSARTGALAEEVQTRYGRIPLPEWLGGDLMLTFRMLLFLGLFIGFAIKVPIFPFHTWLPDAHVEAPTAISVILAGVLLKMGTYGILRISYPLLPAEAVLFCGPLALLAVVNMLYGAFCAMAQTDLKKLVAYSSISHMGYVCLGMAVLTRTGLNGGVLQMFNHGTITAMLFLLVGVIYDRAHHRDINGFGGLGLRVPIYTGITAIAFFASLGLPGLSGFWGEAFVFLGTWEVPAFRGYALAGVFGIIVTAAYLLWTLQRVFMGKLNEKYATLEEISAREMATLLPLLVVVIVVGVYPNPVLSLIQASLNDMSDVFLWLRSQGGV